MCYLKKKKAGDEVRSKGHRSQEELPVAIAVRIRVSK